MKSANTKLDELSTKVDEIDMVSHYVSLSVMGLITCRSNQLQLFLNVIDLILIKNTIDFNIMYNFECN